MSDAVRVVPFGEAAVLVEVGRDVDEATNRRVLALRDAIEGAPDLASSVGAMVAGYASLLVPYAPDGISVEALEARLTSLAADASTAVRQEASPVSESDTIVVPVRYGGAEGPDLEDVASRLGRHPDDVVEMHQSRVYRVYLLGFAPGFAYLGRLPEALHLPRRAEPRLRVPAGSVAIASAQTAVYPFSTAGGWHLLGRTDVRFWDPAAASPAVLEPGDHVRFVAA